MSTKQEALLDIIDTAKRHQITLAEITNAFAAPAEMKKQESSGVLTRVFGYIGGILVFAGLCIFAEMVWDDIGAAGRILITLGTGFCAFIMALTCCKDDRFEKAATPLFLVAAVLQTGGIFVVLDEFSRGGDPAHGILFMSLVMLLQQGLTFWATQRTVLAFTAILFGLSFFGTAFDLLHVPERLNEIVMGTSLMCLAWTLDNTRHKSIAAFYYFIGSALLLFVSYDLVERKSYEVLFLGVSCGFIFLSTVARSRILLINATIATLGYIGYFTSRHFADTIGWPLMLMMMGFVLIGMGALAVRINNKYIKQG